jgi:hypothetical protein
VELLEGRKVPKGRVFLGKVCLGLEKVESDKNCLPEKKQCAEETVLSFGPIFTIQLKFRL